MKKSTATRITTAFLVGNGLWINAIPPIQAQEKPSNPTPPAALKISKQATMGDRGHLLECRMLQHRIKDMNGFELERHAITDWAIGGSLPAIVNGVEYVWARKSDGLRVEIDVAIFHSERDAARAIELRRAAWGKSLASTPKEGASRKNGQSPAPVGEKGKANPAKVEPIPPRKDAKEAGKEALKEPAKDEPKGAPPKKESGKDALKELPKDEPKEPPIQEASLDGTKFGESVWSLRPHKREARQVFLKGKTTVSIVYRHETNDVSEENTRAALALIKTIERRIK